MRKIYLSLFTMFVALGLTAMPVAAFFTAQATVTNNTFSTGTLALRLFYDCIGEEENTALDSAIVDCSGEGQNERGSLRYLPADGATYDDDDFIFNLEGDWTQDNGWWAGLSSAIDHTLIFPGWEFSTPPFSESDILSVGNSGDLPLTLTMNLNFENAGVDEENEPKDGLNPNGGDRIDPWNDSEWETEEERTYYKNLAKVINLRVERVDGVGGVLETTSGNLFDLVNGVPIEFGELSPNEVANIRFSWDMEEEAGNVYQNRIFDYAIVFDGVQADPTP